MRTTEIKRLALTGGPCSGKTSARAMLQQNLQNFGCRVLFVPEAATLMFESGIVIGDVIAKADLYYAFQKQLLLAQMTHEDLVMRYAELYPEDNIVVISDRGLMDGMAYMNHDDFMSMISDLNLALADIRDRRYYAVYHLVSAADGAERSYNFNNAVRYESVDEARAQDVKTRNAWVGHPRLRIVPNIVRDNGVEISLAFDKKMDILLKTVCRDVGMPEPYRVQRKYLVQPDFDPSTLLNHVHISACDITQKYLVSHNPFLERRLRYRSQADCFGSRSTMAIYTEKVIDPVSFGYIEKERIITMREARALDLDADPNAGEVHKKRFSFAWDHQYFQLDAFMDYGGSLRILEVELTHSQYAQIPIIPSFIPVINDITSDKRYSNAALARFGIPK